MRALIGRGHAVALFHRGEPSGGVETIRGDRREAAGWRGEVREVPAGELPEGLAEAFDFSQDLAVDTQRIRKELGFREPVGRIEGLRRAAAWEAAQARG